MRVPFFLPSMTDSCLKNRVEHSTTLFSAQTTCDCWSEHSEVCRDLSEGDGASRPLGAALCLSKRASLRLQRGGGAGGTNEALGEVKQLYFSTEEAAGGAAPSWSLSESAEDGVSDRKDGIPPLIRIVLARRTRCSCQGHVLSI